MGMIALRDDAKRVLVKNFPQSTFLLPQNQVKAKSWWRLW
jgi:outer membrane protein assembly factor BamD